MSIIYDTRCLSLEHVNFMADNEIRLAPMVCNNRNVQSTK